MASVEEMCSNPLLTHNEKAALDSSDVILPPLQRNETHSSNGRWDRRRKCLALAAVATVITTIIVTVLVGISLSGHEDYVIPPSDYSNRPVLDRQTESDKGTTKPSFRYDFRKDLAQFYYRIADRNAPEDLKLIFGNYRKELSEATKIGDFLVVLNADGLKSRFDESVHGEDTAKFIARLTGELSTWYRYLDEVRDDLSRYETQKEFAKSGGKESARAYVLAPHIKMDERKRNEFGKLLSEYSRPVEVEVGDSFVTFQKGIILLSEIAEMLKSNLTLRKPNVFVFASSILYLDEDLLLPGTNVAFVAPRWSFTRTVSVLLGGSDAIEHENVTAQQGAHGLPGNRGENGGDFLGVGYGKIDARDLQIYSDGGRGGDGQNGANGRNGTVEMELKSFQKCKVLMEDMKLKNIFGELVLYYKIFNDWGCGGSGTDGGVSGEGGRGGRIVLANVDKDEVTFRTGKNGMRGKGGKGGTPGIGANWGCYYYAFGIKESKLNPATVVKCEACEMPSGTKGKDGFNRDGMPMQPEEPEGRFFSDALQRFRIYARRNYENRRIAVLARKLDELSLFYRNTSVQEFATEMDAIHGNVKVEFYESLKRRIVIALNHSDEEDRKNHLLYLLTATLGKIANLKPGLKKWVIIDLETYLDKIDCDIKSMETMSQSVNQGMYVGVDLAKTKIRFLSNSFDRWIAKTRNLRRLREMRASGEWPINARSMTQLTMAAAETLKSLCDGMLSYVTWAFSENYADTRKISSDFETVDIDARIDIDSFAGSESNLSLYLAETSRLDVHRNEMSAAIRALSIGGLSATEVKTRLTALKRSAKILTGLYGLSESDFGDFPAEIENLETTVELLDAVQIKMQFVTYLDHLMSTPAKDLDQQSKNMRKRLFDGFVSMQYQDAVNAFLQWVFPYAHLYERLLTKKETATVDEARNGIDSLRKRMKEYASTIASGDKYIHEAEFSGNNSVGAYYKWYNSEIHADLAELFAGKEITLTADVENAHMFDKSAIKFRTARLEFNAVSGRSDALSSILNNVQVEMKHSGYSHFIYDGVRYVQTGEELDLRYSYELGRNGEPVNFNIVYRKLMEGLAIFSPYTTWTVQLRPISRAEQLMQFVNNVDVSLVGCGSYIEVKGMDDP